MSIFCSLWRCLGSKGEANAAEQEVTPYAKEKDKVLVSDGDVKDKRTDSGKQRLPSDSALEDRDKTAPCTASLRGAKSCEGAGKSPATAEERGRNERQSFLAGDLHNERTLRALLQKAKARLSEQTQAFALELQAGGPPADSSRSVWTSDPELGRLNTQLLETCSVPKPDARALLRVELLLGEVRRWLGARPCPAAATAVLYAVGDGLVHAEHAVRSMGLVRYWQPDNTSVFLALLQLYADLLVQATHAAQLHRQQQQQPQQEDRKGQQQQQQREKGDEHLRRSSGSDVVVLAADQEQLQQQHQQRRLVAGKLMPQLSDISLEYSLERVSQPKRSPLPKQQQPQVPLTFAAAALLLRPDWLDMLSEALELLHFNDEHRLAAAKAGREPQEVLASALQLWCFLTQLVKFAAAHADSVQRMEPCLRRLGALLAPPSGAVPRLLDLPLGEDTLVAQLHALWLLQVLYDMPDAKVLYSAKLADYYVALHHNAMVQSYEASAADPKSAAAELCRIHATLLRSLARHPGAPVRSAFARVKTVDWILEELSLESQLLAAAQHDGGAADADTDSDSEADSDMTVSEDEDRGTAGDGGDEGAEQATPPDRSDQARPLSPITSGCVGAEEEKVREAAAGSRSAGGGPSNKGFSFTYDLNEDVERLIALEDELGQEMELDGFEYDDEGRLLKARSDARMAEALAAEAAAAAAAAETKADSAAAVAPPLPMAEAAARPHLLPQQTLTGPRDLQSCGSFGGSSRRSGGVPRLALTALRSASITSLAGQSPSAAKRPSGQGPRSSYNGNSTIGPLSVRQEGEEEEEPLSDEARTPSPNAAAAATAAERVAVWSSNLMDAYVAAGAGDDSKLPLPPPRSRSRGSGGLGMSAPAAFHPSFEPAPGEQQQQHSQQQQYYPHASSADGAAIAFAAAPAYAVAADEPSPAASARPRELATGSPVHAGPQGELHLMVQSFVTMRASQASGTPVAHGRPPLPAKPSLPPLKMVSALSTESAGTALMTQTLTSSSPSVSARGPPPGSSRAMVLLSASNRINNNAGVLAASPNGAQQQQQPPWAHGGASTAAVLGSSPIRDLNRPFLGSANEVGSPAAIQPPSTGASPRPRPMQPLIPALNLKSLRRRDAGCGGTAPSTDTGRTVPLSSMLRFTNAGSLSNYSGRDSAHTLLRSGGTANTPASSNYNTYNCGYPASALGAGLTPSTLRRITEAEQKPPEATYQEVACQRLLYQDRATHILLLKVLVDLLVTPTGTLDPAYVPQYPAHNGAPHPEFILLWHLNAPRNAGVVHDLCRGAQRRAQQASAAAVRRAAAAAAVAAAAAPRPGNGSPPLDPAQPAGMVTQRQPSDSARDYLGPGSTIASPLRQAQLTLPMMGPPAAAPSAPGAAVTVPTRAGAVTRALQLLSRPLFDASRYTNLQFVARGAFGDIYRARMEPPRTQAWPSPTPSVDTVAAPLAPLQVVIKTIQLPGSPHDACVLADVFGEVSVMERFLGQECICQLLDYGMHSDAYWLVMRRYRCSLAEWRGRQKPLGDLVDGGGGGGNAAAAAAVAARVYLSALSQVVDALRLLASHHVVHFDLKCSNVLIEPLPNVRDGELWAPVGGCSTSSSTGSAHHHVPFRCVLADFGEARAYRCAEEAFTARNRGTEVFKSPEMLLLNATGRTSIKSTAAAAVLASPPSARPRTPPQEPLPTSRSTCAAGPGVGADGSAPTSPAATGRGLTMPTTAPQQPDSSRASTADGTKRTTRQVLVGAGLASDVWSLGCLAYELLSGTVLFGGDYASVTHRVAFGTGEQLSLTEVERGRLANLPDLVDLVEWILVRDPAKRPALDRIAERVEQVRSALAAAY